MTTASQPPQSGVTPSQGARPINPTEVGWQFVPQYYTFVNKSPHRLHCFYTKNSTFSHGTEGEDSKACYGQHEIHNKIMSLSYENCKVFIHSVDAQTSAANGIIIQVVGEMSNRGESWKKFVQTFFLAEQPNGYFVLNDIFRFLKEESAAEDDDEEEAEGADEATEAVTIAQQAPAAEPGPGDISVEQVAVSYDEHPAPQFVGESHEATPQVVEPEPAPEPEVEEPAPQTNGVNGHSEVDESVADVKEAAEPTPEAEPEPVTTIPEPTNIPTAEPVAPVKVPSPAPPTPAAQPTPLPQIAPARPPAPVEPPAPSGPKTWATLAATGSKKWGQVASDAKGVSTAAPASPTPTPAFKNVPRAPPVQHDGPHPNAQAAQTVTTAQCFVKSVTENVAEPVMREALTTRFGAIKELEIVRSKACAFLEFTTVDAARKAILASLPVSQGGEGGIRLEGKPSGPNNLPPRIIVETRKERGERPPPRPRGGAPIAGEGRGIGPTNSDGPTRGGPQGGRGRGSSLRGGRGGPGGPK